MDVQSVLLCTALTVYMIETVLVQHRYNLIDVRMSETSYVGAIIQRVYDTRPVGTCCA